MKMKQNTNKIIEDLKSKVNDLSSEEKEIFRDHLLAYLLFGDPALIPTLPAKANMKGITTEERALIKKLAAQTEALFKAMNKTKEK